MLCSRVWLDIADFMLELSSVFFKPSLCVFALLYLQFQHFDDPIYLKCMVDIISSNFELSNIELEF